MSRLELKPQSTRPQIVGAHFATRRGTRQISAEPERETRQTNNHGAHVHKDHKVHRPKADDNFFSAKPR